MPSLNVGEFYTPPEGGTIMSHVLQRGKDLTKSQFRQGTVPVAGSNGVIGYHDTAIATAQMQPDLTGRHRTTPPAHKKSRNPFI